MKTLHVGCGLLLFVVASHAQQYVISTVAGGAPPPTLAAGTSASLGPVDVSVDAAGNVFISSDNCIFKIDQAGLLTRVAGNGRPGYGGDGGLATSAQLTTGYIAVDRAGNLFVANGRIRKVSAGTSIITTVVGGGTAYPGEGGPASNMLSAAGGHVAVDSAGTLYFVDNGFRVRKVSASGIISTVAGTGVAGFSADGGPATNAQINFVGEPGLVLDTTTGSLFFADYSNNRVRKISPAGVITTFAGTGSPGFSGDGGAASNAQLNGPVGLAVDAVGNLFIADLNNNRVRQVSTNGTITTVVGNGLRGFSGDGGQATAAQLNQPTGVAVDPAGNLLVVDAGNRRVRKVLINGIINTLAGNGTQGFSGDGGPATSAQLSQPDGVAVDTNGNLFVADGANNLVRRVSKDGTITTVAGNGTKGFSGDGGPARSAQLNFPGNLAVDSSGNLFIADALNYRVRKVSSNGVISTVAGNGAFGFSGDGGPATAAQLSDFREIATDAGGNLFIADISNNRIRKVSSDGTISTIAGKSPLTPCSSDCAPPPGDGGPATNAEIGYPTGVATDPGGNVFIADTLYGSIRRVSPDGIITTVAGGGTTNSWDLTGSAPAKNISLVANNPKIKVDNSGNIFILVQTGQILRVSPNGTIAPIAGTGVLVGGYAGDGGPATSALLKTPLQIAIDGSSRIYVADSENSAVRVLSPVSGSVIVSAVLDAASESAMSMSPGKIFILYGGGLGPSQLVANAPTNGAFSTQVGGTTVFVNGIPAPMIYASATQVAAIAPYGIAGSLTAQVTVNYQGQGSNAFALPIAASAPSLFSLNGTGAGQIATVNALTGVYNDAAHPVKAGDYLELFATGEGQTAPAGIDGKLATLPYPAPNLAVSVTVGGVPAPVTYAGAAPGEIAGLMQINIQIPPGVQPGGYVPVVLKVGNASTVNGAAWIAVSGN